MFVVPQTIENLFIVDKCSVNKCVTSFLALFIVCLECHCFKKKSIKHMILSAADQGCHHDSSIEIVKRPAYGNLEEKKVC